MRPILFLTTIYDTFMKIKQIYGKVREILYNFKIVASHCHFCL